MFATTAYFIIDRSSTDEDADKVSSFSPSTDICDADLQNEGVETRRPHLFSTTLGGFKPGQRFLMNRIAIYDETRNLCQSAIHLEPVEPSSLDIAVKCTVKTHYSVPPFSCKTGSLDLKTSLQNSNRENLCDLPVVHQGVVMSVGKTANNFSVKTSKVAASATIIPPTLKKENDEAAKTDSVPLMPLLASISSTNIIQNPGIEFMQSSSLSTLQVSVTEKLQSIG